MSTNKSDPFNIKFKPQILQLMLQLEKSITRFFGFSINRNKYKLNFNYHEVDVKCTLCKKLIGFGRFTSGDTRKSEWSAIGEIEFCQGNQVYLSLKDTNHKCHINLSNSSKESLYIQVM
jgi:hypothetical protein